MPTPTLSSSQTKQQGGLTIVMALVLVAVMGAASFSLSRNAIRELSMAGTVVQGGKAGASADAGLDWVIIWAQGGVNQSDYTAAGPASGQLTLLQNMKDTLASTTGYPATIISGVGDSAMKINSSTSAPSDQDFDIETRYLGTLPPSRTGGGSSDNSGASGGTKVSGSSGDYLWRMVATGRATPKGSSLTYTAQRELVATLPPF
jgi:hypothetical protein